MIRAITSTTRRSRARARRAARPARTAAPVIRAWTRLAIIWIIRLMRGMLLSFSLPSLSPSYLFLSRVLCLFVWYRGFMIWCCLPPLFFYCLNSFLSIHLFVLPTLHILPRLHTFLPYTSESLSGLLQGLSLPGREKKKAARKICDGKRKTRHTIFTDSSFPIPCLDEWMNALIDCI